MVSTSAKMIWVCMFPALINPPELKTARKLLGKDKIIGVSVNTIQEAEAALRDGADYLGNQTHWLIKAKQKELEQSLTPPQSVSQRPRAE